MISLASIHKHPVYDTDLHLIIDPVTRSVNNNSGKTVLMQNDHNSERFTFELPRYIEEHDMTLCNIVEVHYINISGTNKSEQSSGIYSVDDLSISRDDENVVTGTWLVSRNGTVYPGSLNAIFRFACVDEDTHEITYQWFSDIYTGLKISKGIYNADALTEDNDTDILAAWKQEVISAAQENAKIITDGIIHMLNEAEQTLLDYYKQVSGIMFTVNFETGNLEYISPNITFVVNEDTGNLEWSTDSNSLEDLIKDSLANSVNDKFASVEEQLNKTNTKVNNIESVLTGGNT